MSTAQVVVASAASGWVVQSADGAPLSAQLRTQAEAVGAATELLGGAGGGEVVVQGRDGAVRRRLVVAAAPSAVSVATGAPTPSPAGQHGFCPGCGTPHAPGEAYCGSCGAPAAGPRAAGTGPAGRPRPLPAWVITDWPAAVLLAVGSLLGLLLVCVAYGMLLGGTAGGADGILPGLVLGLLLPFAAYGAELVVFAGDDGSGIGLLQDHLPLVLTAGAAGITFLALRWGLGRLRGQPARARALAVKVVVLQSLLLTLVGAFADQGEFAFDDDSDGFLVVSAVSQVHAGFVALLLGLLVSGLALRRVGLRALGVEPPLLARRVGAAARAGAAAWVLMVVVLGVAAVVGTAVAVDGTRERSTIGVSAPLLIGGTGVATAAVAHGGAAGYVGDEQLGAVDDDSEDPDDARLSVFVDRGEHTSLLDWSLPVRDVETDTPWWAYLLLAAPLTTLVAATVLLLRRAQPPTESWAVALSLVLATGYTAASWVLTKAVGLSVGGGGSELDWGFSVLVVRPGVGSSLGLPLLWSVVVCPLAAFAWSRRRRLPGSVFGSLATGAPQEGPAPTAPTAGALCPACGAGLSPAARYCGSCGAVAPAPTGG